MKDHLTTRDAEHTLTAMTGWGRYAETFFYDHKQQLFSLGRPWEQAE